MSENVSQVVRRLCYAIMLPMAQILYFVLNWTTDSAHNVSTFIDRHIPFNQYFVVPYVFWYVFVVIILAYFAVKDSKIYFRMLTGMTAGILICCLIYLIYPTTIARPDISGSDPFTRLVLIIYSNDQPYNCAPSIHVLNTVLPTMLMFGFSKKYWVKALVAINAIVICLSTMFIKQHAFIDVLSAIVLALIMYPIISSDYIWSRVPVKRVIDLIVPAKLRQGGIEPGEN